MHKAKILISLMFISCISHAQPGWHPDGNFGLPPIISFGVHIDPIISWFATDIYGVSNEGARPGFNFGVSYNRYFSPNYSFSTGVNIINAGGRLVSKTNTLFELVNYKDKIANVAPGDAIVYKIQYLAVPLGLKFQTNQIGYITFFSDIGIDPKVVIGGKVNIPSLDIIGEKATAELKSFNLSYHIIAGIEYAIGGNTAAVLGLGFDNNFIDITKDRGDQPNDKVTHKLLSFRFGINF